MLTRRYIVKGRVQGVGYRYFVLRCARERGLTGYAKNLWDGDVEVVAQGDSEALDALETDLRRGPRAAHVLDVARDDIETPPFDGFGIEFS
ncbi:MAG: acylphosphatase [Acidobacteria bacterium]|nr:acylphosphatase [Acidobacteriota bacterium]